VSIVDAGEKVMRVLIVGGRGVIGSAVASALRDRHEVVVAGRSEAGLQVDASDPRSVASLFATVGSVDALVATLGSMHFGPAATMTPDAFRIGLDSKLMGQVNLALLGQKHLSDGGSITLTSGVLGPEPIRLGVNACAVNHAVEGFVRGAAIDLPRGLRINAVSPGVVAESYEAVKAFVPGFETVSAARVAMAYVRAVEGGITGRVLAVHG
jgi:NAD(P)-dependent dehydrogenase (short-subunit alcohol dehydrogenase family)